MTSTVTFRYFDNAATTAVDPETLEAMSPYFLHDAGNPSSLHAAGRDARRAIDGARQEVAELLGFEPQELVFTAGATEANNLALIGRFFAEPAKRHLITCATEHHAVLHTCDWLETQGARITRIGVDASGRVDPDAVEDAIDNDTLLVSVMAGNNEIGTVQPIDDIGQRCRARGVSFHTDAVQAFGKIPLPAETCDLLSLSAHKFHGPKGVGLLAVRGNLRLVPLLHGGGHEGGRRSGTENVPGIVGLAHAARRAIAAMPAEPVRLDRFRARIVDELERLPGTRLNGHRTESLPHIVNFGFEGIEGESLVMKLDEHGIAASTGSACSSPHLEASHVLLSLGVPITVAHGSLRLSTGRYTTSEDVDELLRVVPIVVEELRAISPFKVGA
jgi:cysteine desulfurase